MKFVIERIIFPVFLILILFNLGKILLTDRQCNKRRKIVFQSCIYERFPSGTNFNELEFFLVSREKFVRAKAPEYNKENNFLFIWSSTSLTSYRVIVRGQYDEDLKIMEIEVY